MTHDIKHLVNTVIHPTIVESIMKHHTLANKPAIKNIWTTAVVKELGCLTQGDSSTKSLATYTNFFIKKPNQKYLQRLHCHIGTIGCDHCP